jgi:hypothetical protein
MTDVVTFLPSLRRGLAQRLVNVETLNGLPRNATIDAAVDIAGGTAAQTVPVQGPDAVAGIAPAQILRTEPQPGSADVEPNYFPLVELAAPDLPWMFTPARPDGQGRLRPWLVLVAVREQDGVSLVPGTGGSLPILHIDDPAGELPDLAESWAWVHVHSLVGVEEIADAVGRRSGEVIARLLCPRRLLPDSAWIAALVPAFDGGRLRGLGEPLPDGVELQPAWTDASLASPIDLPVYHHWRFATGAAGDFESLCRRLKPDGDGAELGLHPLDVTDPGLVTPAGTRVLLDMEGALHTLEAQPRAWDATHKATFQPEIAALVNEGAGRPEATLEEPVVAPPLYGCRPAGATEIPAKGWLRTLNEHPVRRAAAGLGARAVRASQEALVAAAWDQAGALRETVEALNRARLGAEIGRSLARRAGALADGDLLQLTAPLQAFLRAGGGSVRSQLEASAIPGGLVSAAYVRQTRLGTPLARDWAARTATGARLTTRHTELNLQATAEGGSRAVLEFAQYGAPAGAWTTDGTLFDHLDVVTRAVPRQKALEFERALARRGRSRPATSKTARPQPGQRELSPVADVSDLATTVRAVLDPLASVRASVVARVPALDGLIAAGSLPTTVPVGPVFPDPMYWDLLALGTHWVMPGVGKLGANRVRLVETDTNFVGAFLIGANHELGRELLWRGYPVDLRATFFDRFWSYLDPERTDIPPLHAWFPDKTIRDNMGAGEDGMTVIVVRGDVVRRYPTAHCYLHKATRESGSAQPLDGGEVEPDFLGTLGIDTAFYGFSALDPEDVRGSATVADPGYFFVIEEQPGAPRFGLDPEKAGQFDNDPVNWNALAWGHLVRGWDELELVTHARADNERLTALDLPGGTTWGYNAAHMARACWQRPFRMLIHADDLV